MPHAAVTVDERRHPGETVTEADGRFSMDAPLVKGEPYRPHLVGSQWVLQQKGQDMAGAGDARYLMRHEDQADAARELSLVALRAAFRDRQAGRRRRQRGAVRVDRAAGALGQPLAGVDGDGLRHQPTRRHSDVPRRARPRPRSAPAHRRQRRAGTSEAFRLQRGQRLEVPLDEAK